MFYHKKYKCLKRFFHQYNNFLDTFVLSIIRSKYEKTVLIIFLDCIFKYDVNVYTYLFMVYRAIHKSPSLKLK